MTPFFFTEITDFIFNNMIVDFTNTSGKVYFNDFIEPYGYYRLILTSRYSNKKLKFSVNEYIKITLDSNYTKWCSFDFIDLPTDLTQNDIGGYYDVEVWGSNNDTTYTLLKKELGKVINNFTAGITTSYVSDNENNEEHIYYRK